MGTGFWYLVVILGFILLLVDLIRTPRTPRGDRDETA